MNFELPAFRRARLSRDARFDGRFFVGVRTTGIYCRPICPAPAPLEKNVRYFASAAAAADAGLRPCLRCRPESAPGPPAWTGTSATLSRALRLIGDGALDDRSVDDLAARLGVTARHVRRLFLSHLGATPLDVARMRRAQFAKKLIDETNLPFADVALASGFGSIRRFNGVIHATHARTPTALRARRARREVLADVPGEHVLRLAFRAPLDWPALLGFLRGRATPGVEVVDAQSYRRLVAVGESVGEIDVRRAAQGDVLEARLRGCEPRALLPIVERIRRVLDLDADPASINAHLRSDPMLAPLVRRHPGLRVPGAWDGFEVAVRAILGQQVSVKAATTLAGRLASQFGTRVEGFAGLTHLSPTPAQLADAGIEKTGVVSARARAIRHLACAVADGTIRLDGAHADLETALDALRALPGIGDWTAQYIAMRAFSEPDAFPSGDLVLRRVMGLKSQRDMTQRAEAWRPWRAYAAMHLWRGSADDEAASLIKQTRLKLEQGIVGP